MRDSPPLMPRCFFAALSGVFYALAFPPVNGHWLILPAVMGLLLAVRGLRGRSAFYVGFVHGMVAFGMGLPWLWHVFGAGAPALWAILAAFTGAFAVTQGRAVAVGLRGWQLALFTMVNWAAWEFIRAELFPLRFPWMTTGLALGPNALLPRVGVYGAGACLVLGAALLVGRRWFPGLTTLGVLAALTFLHGPVPTPKEDTIQVAAIQREGASLYDLIQSTRELPKGVQHVVWPEHALSYDVRGHAAEWNLLTTFCKERDITLTLGTHTNLTGEEGRWYNTALTLDALGVRGEHHKVHPVHFFDDGTPGTTALPVPTGKGFVGTPVCFDCDFASVARRMTAAGAEVLMVPSMDAEHWGAWQHLQHAELFRIRAAENARWMLVAASSGVSQIIDSNGHVHASLPPLTDGVLTGVLQRRTPQTFFTRVGWLAPWFMLGAAGVWWFILLLPGRAAKNRAT
ncbi:MAG TPA: nitrilase-related carbon-nitrogen hydrolase [Candidatus Saccharimonadia bacterium]|nr:nitrilase-related carbon-nitrogen hydrolase [Candidatus Saccharimonadia bacterium]